MDNNRFTNDNADSRASVLLERHLQNEFKLVENLAKLGVEVKALLEKSGAIGLTLEQANDFEKVSRQISLESSCLKNKRAGILGALNAGHSENGVRISIREYIQTLDSVTATRLEKLRQQILDQLTEVHATTLGNRAVLFYSFDFYRRMVAGILNNDVKEGQYGVKGLPAAVKPGNFYREVC